MGTFDAHKNFALSSVATAPSPATSGTSLVVTGGDGVKFPAVPFNAVIWPTGAKPLSSNAEIVRVTAIATDTFTITRQQEGTSARSVIIGDQIMDASTAKVFTDLEALWGFALLSAQTMDEVLPASSDFLYNETLELGATTVLEIPATSSVEIATNDQVIRMDKQPVFCPSKFLVYRAAADTDGNAGFKLMTFDTKVFDTNNDYSTSTGKFTAPVAGYYQFNWTVSKSQTANTAMLSGLQKNGVTYASLSDQAYQGATTGGAGTTGSAFIFLDKGETVSVQSYGSGGAISVGLGSFGGTAFGGFLVSQL